jgi:hypothetical protein
MTLIASHVQGVLFLEEQSQAAAYHLVESLVQVEAYQAYQGKGEGYHLRRQEHREHQAVGKGNRLEEGTEDR